MGWWTYKEQAKKAAAKVEARGTAMIPEVLKELRRRFQKLTTLCANKVAIVVYAFQVIYQYANIVTGYEFDFDYPEPAKSGVECLSTFGLNILSLSPPECVNPDSNFYTRVLIATLSPVGVIVVGVVLVLGVYNSCRGERARVEPHQMWSYVLVFLEFVLSGVATVVCKTFMCEEIEGEGKVLLQQPTLLCEDLDGKVSTTRRFFEVYSGLMILVYPVGVPVLILVLLMRRQNKIMRVMKAKMAIVADNEEFERIKFPPLIEDEEGEWDQAMRLREWYRANHWELEEEELVKRIARYDSTRRESIRHRSEESAKESAQKQLSADPATWLPQQRSSYALRVTQAGDFRTVVVNTTSLDIEWRAVIGTSNEVAFVDCGAGDSVFVEGEPPWPGDRLLRVGDTDVAVARAGRVEGPEVEKKQDRALLRLYTTTLLDAVSRSRSGFHRDMSSSACIGQAAATSPRRR